MKEPNIQPQKPIQAAIENLQKTHSHPLSWRSIFSLLSRKNIPIFTFYSLSQKGEVGFLTWKA